MNDQRERSIDGAEVIVVGLYGQSVPPRRKFEFSDGQRYIRGITVLNQSSVGVGLYFNRESQAAVPDYLVLPGYSSSVPVAKLKFFTTNYLPMPGIGPTGQIYVHFTTDLVANISSPVALAPGATAIWDSSLWDGSAWD